MLDVADWNGLQIGQKLIRASFAPAAIARFN
jgi:hypothetical protein